MSEKHEKKKAEARARERKRLTKIITTMEDCVLCVNCERDGIGLICDLEFHFLWHLFASI